MKFFTDTQGQLCLEWTHWPGQEGMHKRAWIQRRQPRGSKDWAGAPEGRYVIVASLSPDARPLQGPDFPVFSDLSDKEVLMGIANAITGVVGCDLPEGV